MFPPICFERRFAFSHSIALDSSRFRLVFHVRFWKSFRMSFDRYFLLLDCNSITIFFLLLLPYLIFVVLSTFNTIFCNICSWNIADVVVVVTQHGAHSHRKLWKISLHRSSMMINNVSISDPPQSRVPCRRRRLKLSRFLSFNLNARNQFMYLID